MEDPTQIQSAAVTHFSNLFLPASTNIDLDLFDIFGHSVLDHQNEVLCVVPSPQEIHDAVFSLKRNRASGADGFFGSFFALAWNIVGDDVIRATQHFFLFGQNSPSHQYILPNPLPQGKISL